MEDGEFGEGVNHYVILLDECRVRVGTSHTFHTPSPLASWGEPISRQG